MSRCRVVQGEHARLFLADPHKRAHAELLANGVTKGGKKRPATAAELAVSAARVRSAEADGDWIEVRRRLNAGEQRAMFARMYLAGINGLRVNPLETGLAKVTAYLLDWSLVGPDGKVIPIAGRPIDEIASAVDSIDPESFAELQAAIDAHEEAVAQEREAEKNVQAGERNTSAISPSLSEPAGALSGLGS